MKLVEKLLQQARKKETIEIDSSFKDQLYTRIQHTSTESSYKPRFLQRFGIIIVPLLVSITLFFFFYQEEQKIALAPSTTHENIEIKEEAMLFSNRSQPVATSFSETTLEEPTPMMAKSIDVSLESASGSSFLLGGESENTVPLEEKSQTGVTMNWCLFLVAFLLLLSVLFIFLVQKKRR